MTKEQKERKKQLAAVRNRKKAEEEMRALNNMKPAGERKVGTKRGNGNRKGPKTSKQIEKERKRKEKQKKHSSVRRVSLHEENKRWRDWRESDGVESPVVRYHIDDLKE
ncbi:hypothetical protein FZC84_21095 [Rossellomorea vietnamensis]|uniref:Uncharacterized protein n=1 Tax=Rossellomorea vietnamensis TaxID=218284 RepID=A0A5D4M2D2_9BACI|nr:hypothetical protein [Rossellomorea vietnamensis]TYR95691.1 hypothetical protein FZC84_21095 [Rossellomorea vietnamensis]